MKSIKPGRGPSMMQGIVGIFVALFGVFWTIAAASMGGGLFAVFGIFFVIMAIVQAVYNLKNATGENRYSVFDITDGHEEPDPFQIKYGSADDRKEERTADQTIYADADSSFCPYCGTKVEDDYAYCHKCGKRLPY